MKKLFSIIFVLIVLCVCAACGEKLNGEKTQGTDAEAYRKSVDTVIDTENTEPAVYPVQYIRTDGYREDVDFPYTVNIGSVSELESYIEENEEHYSLGHADKVYSDTTIGFADAVKGYDEAFFESNMLVMAIFEEGSGSNRHELVGVTADDVIHVKRITPEEGTCDMAEWHIIMEMPRERAYGYTFTAEYYGEDNRELAVFAHNFVLMSARVPKGWDYEGKVHNMNSDTLGIELYPLDSTESRVKIYFVNRDYLMYCGTGYDFTNVTAGKYEATRITSLWAEADKTCEIYSFNGFEGIYALEICGFAENKAEYQDDINEIIDTFEITEMGFIDREEALEIAKNECTVDYDNVYARFDLINGIWSVDFLDYDNDTAGVDQTVNLNANGKFLSSEYGE